MLCKFKVGWLFTLDRLVGCGRRRGDGRSNNIAAAVDRDPREELSDVVERI